MKQANWLITVLIVLLLLLIGLCLAGAYVFVSNGGAIDALRLGAPWVN
jgi:uncharacterized membrane protein